MKRYTRLALYSWLSLMTVTMTGVAYVHISQDSGVAIPPDFRKRTALAGEKVYKAAGCQSCHGEKGRYPVSDTYPRLAGQNSGYLYNQLSDIKSGARVNGLSGQMVPMLNKLTEPEMRAVADWLSGE